MGLKLFNGLELLTFPSPDPGRYLTGVLTWAFNGTFNRAILDWAIFSKIA